MKRTIFTLAIASLLVGTAVYSAREVNSTLNTFGDGDEPIKPGIRPTVTFVTKTKTQPPAQDPKPVKAQKQPKVEIVIALDTSGSMSGLINSARQKLWDIVNEVAKAQPTPKLRVGLVTFGSQGTEKDGYVIVRSDLTTDLDTIYSRLFELTTWGGEEYVGRAVFRATRELSWDKDPDTLRQIYVAGNESADQDRRVTSARAVKLARKHDIYINAIYCGSASNSDASSWRRVAQSGAGIYAAIDHDHGTVAIATPYDARINALSARLNRTYVAYGPRGSAGLANQKAQDKNAASVHSSAAASRAKAKVSGVYHNPGWDLVDARKAGKLKKIKREQLPAPVRAMSESELNAYIDGKEKERKQLKQQILELSKKRQAYVAAEMKKQGKSEGKAFNTAVKRALRRQAAEKKIVIK
jgi:hypothetical protein